MSSRKINRLLNYQNMKNYKKQKYSGNENGWHEPIVTLGVHNMHEEQAEALNDQFRNTGIKYEETDIVPHEFKKATNNEANHGEPNLEVKDGEVVVKYKETKPKAAPKTKKKAETPPQDTKQAEHVDNGEAK